MAYIGAEPLPGQNREVDDISSSFNGSTTAFTLQVNGLNVSPETANNILVNIGGVIQNPGTDYTIAASTITFTTAPASGLSFFAIILGAGINTATVADDTIGPSKLIDTAVTAGSYTTADITVDAQGRITAAASGTIANAEIADGAITNAKVNASAAIDVSKLSGVMPLAGGTFTGDVTFDGQTAGRDILFDRSRDALAFKDNAVAEFGTGVDLQIYHDGSDSFIQDGGTGSLKILSNQTQIINAANSENIANFNQDGTVELFHNNGRKFQTLSTGINVYGSGSTFLELGSVAGGTDSVFIDTSHASNTKPNMDFKLDGDLALRIDTSGNLNIGLTSSPVSSNSEQGVFLAGADATQSVISSSTTPLVVNRVGTGGNDRNCVELRNNGTLRGTIGALGAADGIFFQYGASEGARINSAGRFLIGTTTIADSNSAQLVVLGQLPVTPIEVRQDTTSNHFAITFRNSNGQIGSVRMNGSTTFYDTSSDYRLKENAIAISDGITRLKTLKPYRFNFKADASKTVDGFFAHEVTAVPEAINGTKDQVDSNGDPVIQSIDQSKLVPLLTASLQEAVAKIETLETKVAALEAA